VRLPAGPPPPSCSTSRSLLSAPAPAFADPRAVDGCSVKQIGMVSRKFKIWGAGREVKNSSCARKFQVSAMNNSR
jgi:hypothetical protein